MTKKAKKTLNDTKTLPKKIIDKQKVINKSQNLIKGIKYVRFLDFLNHLHQRIGKSTLQQSDGIANLNEITQQLMIFFNKTRKYTQNELDVSIICLANLLTFIRNQINHLEFQKQFKNKLKNFLKALQCQHNIYPQNHKSKIIAIFYILAVMICQQYLTISEHMIALNKSIYSDANIVKSLLNIIIFPQVRLSKFYGIVLQYLSHKIYKHKQKEILIKSIILNFKNIKNQSTLINLLIYLRIQKNKVKISYDDVIKGEIIQVLMESYPKYIDKHQSTYILDYIHHLIVLFPQLSIKAVNNTFLTFLIQQTKSQNYHPLQQIPLLNLIQFALNIPCKFDKSFFLNFCMNFILSKTSFSFKLLQIIIEFDINVHQLLLWIQSKGFEGFLDIMNRQGDNNLIIKSIKTCNKVVKKVQVWNKSIATYLNFQLCHKLKLLENRLANGRQIIELINRYDILY